MWCAGPSASRSGPRGSSLGSADRARHTASEIHREREKGTSGDSAMDSERHSIHLRQRKQPFVHNRGRLDCFRG
jgi:hypothetical protein